MKSLLIVTEAFDIGGLETHISGEIIALTQAGCRVHLATSHRFNSLLLPQEVASVTNNLILGPEATLADFNNAVIKLRQLIREHAVECVHAHPFTSLLPSFVAAELERVPFVFTLHGPASLCSYGPLYDFILTSVVLPNAGLVVGVSEEVAALASPYLSQGEVFVLPNGVDVNTFLPTISDQEIDQRWLVISRLDSFKIVGIVDFINKAKSAGLPGVLLVGDGPAREELQQRLNHDGLADFVEFYGMSADVPRLMQAAVGVAGMGRVVLEGLASRKPVCLVGYDGVKGLVDQNLLAHASQANFSGRNLNSIDNEVFCELFNQLSKINSAALYEVVSMKFSEPSLWMGFLEKIKTIGMKTPSLLSDSYSSLLANGVKDTVPLLQSSVLFEQLGRMIHSQRHFDQSLVASFLYHRGRSMEMTLHQVVADRDRQITGLNQALTEREKQIRELEVIRSNFQQEMMQMSDWAQQINERPLRYGIKKHLRKIVKAAFHSIPLDLSVKQGFKSRVMRFLRLSKELVNNAGMSTGIRGSGSGSACQTALGRSAKTTSPFLLDLAKGSNLKERDIFVFSVIDWYFRIQRPQHLARSFAKAGKRVFFFSNHFIDASEPGYELERLDPDFDLYQIKLHVKGAPAIYFAPPTDEAMVMIQDGIAQLMQDITLVSSISLVQHAYWYPLVSRLPNTLKVYDCMDNHEGFGNVPEKLIMIEKTMLRESDLVVVTSNWLETFARKHNANVEVVRNAGEYAYFSAPPAARYIDPLGRKIIGYYGAIAEWFDLDLIRSVAKENPHALILLVGNDTINAEKKLKDLKNIVFTGEVPYSRLPYYLYAFDVCLLPFEVIPLTLATNPVKIYEYLAAGKPVVSVDLPEIAQFGELVFCARTHDEFVQMVIECISLPQAESAYQRRMKFASEQTWDHRVEELALAIRNIPLPKISVVVLTYNNLDLTKACLDSLVQWSDYPNLEIIVVDNASSDDTPNYLREFKEQHPQVKILLNDKNLGFSAGNNVGLVAATGDYLVMLNNDTIVTPGWLLTMLRHLQFDPSIGLIGPVTNNIGNEAKIDLHYNTPAEMLPLAIDYTTGHMGHHFPIRTAAFFCVMMSRKVFEQVGLLDESFGRGFFEDDDYCRRIEEIGLRVVCAEDVYIHHHLSASFDKLKSHVRQKLFDENMAIYEAKWGKWVPHTYQRGSVPRKKRIALR